VSRTNSMSADFSLLIRWEERMRWGRNEKSGGEEEKRRGEQRRGRKGRWKEVRTEGGREGEREWRREQKGKRDG
jgi:hypothetical protein